MKQGRTLESLGAELQRQRAARKDFVADTRSLRFATEGKRSGFTLASGERPVEFGVNPLAHQQISARLGIPLKYYQRMQQDAPALLDANVNNWLQQNPERRMLRVMDGNVRAFLSDRYRRLDNLELCAAVLPIIHEMKGAAIESCEVTEAHLYLKVINRKMKAEVAVGDAVQAGLVISNSEVGLGHLTVEPLIYRLACKNGMICKDFSQRKRHVGRQVELSDAAYELYSDETLAQDDKAFFMKVQDTVRCAVDEAKFLLTVDKLREAMQIPLEHPPMQEVELLADRFSLTENERGDIFRQLFISGDSTRYGLHRKAMRQIFAYKPDNGLLLQSRLYNSFGGTYGAQEDSKLYRDLIQREISGLEDAPNLWKTCTYVNNPHVTILAGTGFGGYTDWTYEKFDAKISIRNDHGADFAPFTVGTYGLCIQCGCEINENLYCSDCMEDEDDDESMCEECESFVDEVYSFSTGIALLGKFMWSGERH